MRRLLWFTLGFGAACAVSVYWLSGEPLAVLSAAALLLSLFSFALWRKHRVLKRLSALLLGIGLGFLWYWNFQGSYLTPVRELDGVTTEATIEINDYCFETDYGVGADGVATWQGKTYLLRLYLGQGYVLNPGDTVSGTFRFRITHDGEEESTYHRGIGIVLIAYQVGDVTIAYQDASWWTYPAQHIRHGLITMIREIFPADTESFARALLLGDDNDIDYDLNTAFKVSGIRHIIAVSGLHISILFGLIYMIAGKHRFLTALLGIPVLCIFAGVAGFTPSVVRACIMHGLMMLALLFDREYDPPTAVSFAALVMLAVNPLVITSVSFQLSLGCMAGMFLFSENIKNWLLDEKRLGEAKGKTWKDRLIRWFAGSVSVSLGAVSLTTPLAALYFGAVSLISPLTNLLTLGIVTLVFYGVMAVCLVGFFWTEAAVVLAWLVSWPIRYITGITALLAQIPMAAVYTRSIWIVIWLCVTYALLSVFVIWHRRHPLPYACFVVITLCLALLVSWVEPTLDQCRMTVLDVGQGQSIILQSAGRTFVVDCGGSYADDAADATAETLLSMGLKRIDGLILTHYDEDHAGGVEYLLSRIQTDQLYLPAWEDENQLGMKLAQNANGKVYLVQQDLSLSFEGTIITIFAPEVFDSGNESSLCVLFQAGDCDILITGDRSSLGEKLLLHRAELPTVDILVAGHHGSKYSTSQELLDAVKPRLVVISVDGNNSYGHPAPEMLARLKQADCDIYRTDQHGTVIIRR